MPNQIIYLTDELYQKFKEEKNKSRLVCTLLNNHYSELDYSDKPIGELKKELLIIEVQEEAQKKIEEIKSGKSKVE